MVYKVNYELIPTYYETSEKMCFETPAQKTQNTKITICTNFDEVLNVFIVYQL